MYNSQKNLDGENFVRTFEKSNEHFRRSYTDSGGVYLGSFGLFQPFSGRYSLPYRVCSVAGNAWRQNLHRLQENGYRKMTKAIFFDIDGTLLASNEGIYFLTERVKKALRRLKSAGHYIFIATGRPYAFLQEEILNFGFDGFVILNGAVVIVDGKVIFQSPLDKSAVKKICEYAESENIEYILEGHPQIYFRRDAKAIEDFFNKIRVDSSNFVRDFDIDEVETFKIECVTFRKDVETLDKIYKKILATPGFNGWSDPFRFKSLEVSSRAITKAEGVFLVLSYLGIGVENSYAFGDGYNDIEMISRVGTGIAINTASDDLKRHAKFIVPSAKDDGVAVGIEKYILADS